MPTQAPRHTTIHTHFAEVATRYDSGRQYEKVDFWAQEALRLSRPRPGDWLLDVGCGTGFFTRSLAELWPGPVIGLDPSLPMLNQAAAKYAGRAGSPSANTRTGLRRVQSVYPLRHVVSLCVRLSGLASF